MSGLGNVLSTSHPPHALCTALCSAVHSAHAQALPLAHTHKTHKQYLHKVRPELEEEALASDQFVSDASGVGGGGGADWGGGDTNPTPDFGVNEGNISIDE